MEQRGGPLPGRLARLVVVPFGQRLTGATGRVTPCPFLPAPRSGRPRTSYISSASYLVFYPGLCIMITVLALNILGNGLRDALDPRLK